MTALAVAAMLAACTTGGDDTSTTAPSPSGPTESIDVSAAVEDIETEYDAQVGVVAIEVEGDRSVSYREDERFGFASTMKAYAAAALLDSTGEQELERLVRWSAEDVEAAGYSPVTEQVVDDGLSLGELAEASVRESDNTAMNLVLDEIGGPQGLQDALRAAGDDVSEVADVEPGLNDVTPGDPANTSTAEALAQNLVRIMSGEWLSEDDRSVLVDWMSGNVTGDSLVRAGAPQGWDVVDKSGGAGSLRNDVAVAFSPDGEPVVVVVLTERNDPAAEIDDALVASVADVVLSALD